MAARDALADLVSAVTLRLLQVFDLSLAGGGLSNASFWNRALK